MEGVSGGWTHGRDRGNMRVCLLGGGNPHALAVARYFSTVGIDCFGIGRNPPKAGPLWLAPPSYRYYQAHLDSQLALALRWMDDEKPDVVISFAAQGEGAASFGADAWRFYQTNCVMLVRLVEALRSRSYVKRFIQIGTSELYGSVTEPAAETAPVRATSPYSISKAAFDAHLEVMHRVHGFPMNVVRPSNCICAGQQLHRIAPRAAISAIYRQRMQLAGGGAARKSYLDSEDLARALLVVIEKAPVGVVLNAGPIQPVSIREVVTLTAEAVGVPLSAFVDETPARLGEDSQYWLDSSKLRALGWEPTITLQESVSRVVDWARQYPEIGGMPWHYRVTP